MKTSEKTAAEMKTERYLVPEMKSEMMSEMKTTELQSKMTSKKMTAAEKITLEKMAATEKMALEKKTPDPGKKESEQRRRVGEESEQTPGEDAGEEGSATEQTR